MPMNTSNQDAVADIESTNPGVQDGSRGGANGPDPDIRTTGKAATHMSTGRISSTSTNLPSEEIRNQPINQPGPTSQNGRQSSQDSLLQIPSEGGAARRPIETSIWDWDTPLESVGESSSYYYEPQGELLQEHREQRSARNEFSIPHAVATSNSNWPFPPLAGSAGAREGFAVPRRPSGVPASLAGQKRKSESDREGFGSARQPEQKRSSRIMSETGDESGSPVEARPPAHSTRSQSGPTSRPQGGAEDPEGGLTMFDVDTGQSRPGASGQRRTLEDPAIPMVLPARKVFPIQIGDKLFRLSGASISSDGEHITFKSFVKPRD